MRRYETIFEVPELVIYHALSYNFNLRCIDTLEGVSSPNACAHQKANLKTRNLNRRIPCCNIIWIVKFTLRQSCISCSQHKWLVSNVYRWLCTDCDRYPIHISFAVYWWLIRAAIGCTLAFLSWLNKFSFSGDTLWWCSESSLQNTWREVSFESVAV